MGVFVLLFLSVVSDELPSSTLLPSLIFGWITHDTNKGLTTLLNMSFGDTIRLMDILFERVRGDFDFKFFRWKVSQ